MLQQNNVLKNFLQFHDSSGLNVIKKNFIILAFVNICFRENVLYVRSFQLNIKIANFAEFYLENMTGFEDYIKDIFANDFMKLLWDTIPDGIYVTNKEGKILLANDTYCKMISRRPEQIIGSSFADNYQPNFRFKMLNDYNRNFLLYQIFRHFRQELILWNGDKVFFEFSNRRLRTSNIEEVMLTIVKDISKEKNKEIEEARYETMQRNFALHQEKVREEERKKIAREIHDELGQVLTVLKIQLSLASKKLTAKQVKVKEKINEAEKTIVQGIDSVQRICSQLRPEILDNLGLTAAIEWQTKKFEKDTNIKCSCSVYKDELVIQQQKATAIYRIFQETLTNIARHSKATSVEIEFLVRGNDLLLEVRDNGVGIPTEKINHGSSFGLRGMRERANIFKGEIDITGTPGEGTIVKLRVPKKDNRELIW